MEQVPINIIIFEFIPRSILVISLGFILIGMRPPFKNIALASIVQGVAVYYIRTNTEFGVNILLQYITMCLLVWLIVRISLRYTVLGVLIGFVISSLVEGVIVVTVPEIIGISLVEILSRSWGRIGLFSPQLLVLAILIHLCIKHNFTLEKEMEVLKRYNKV